MAAEETKPAADAPAKEAGESKPSGGKGKLIMILGIGGGAAIIGVALALFVVKPMLSGSSEPAGEQTEAVEEHHEAEASEGGHGEGHGAETSIYTIKDLVVNPAGTGGSRYLSISIAFQMGNPEEVTVLEANEPIVRDALITILSSKTVAQLTDMREKEIARLQIKNRVTQLLHNVQVGGVYYADFVLQ